MRALFLASLRTAAHLPRAEAADFTGAWRWTGGCRHIAASRLAGRSRLAVPVLTVALLVISLTAAVTSRSSTARAAAPAGSPVGAVNSLMLTPKALHTSGWAYDPNTPTRPIEIAVYSDCTQMLRAVGQLSRTDVARAYPAAGPNHGFNLDVTGLSGTHKICVYALNVGPGANNRSSAPPSCSARTRAGISTGSTRSTAPCGCTAGRWTPT